MVHTENTRRLDQLSQPLLGLGDSLEITWASELCLGGFFMRQICCNNSEQKDDPPDDRSENGSPSP
jgi:hypothetical protein